MSRYRLGFPGSEEPQPAVGLDPEPGQDAVE